MFILAGIFNYSVGYINSTSFLLSANSTRVMSTSSVDKLINCEHFALFCILPSPVNEYKDI